MTSAMNPRNEEAVLPKTGLCHIYTGDGKGKTTASIGLLVRAAGAGMKTLFCQFLKGWDTAELVPLETIGVEILRTGKVKKFIPYMTEAEKEECVKSHKLCYNRVKEKIFSGEYGLIVLDEAIAAARLDLIPLSDLAETVKSRPAGLEIVLTGRDAPRELTDLADYISEIRPVRHPFEKGIQARRGIEF